MGSPAFLERSEWELGTAKERERRMETSDSLQREVESIAQR